MGVVAVLKISNQSIQCREQGEEVFVFPSGCTLIGALEDDQKGPDLWCPRMDRICSFSP